MNDKCKHSIEHSQHLIAGLLPKDSGIEFYGLPLQMQVQWLQNGKSHSFKELDRQSFAILSNAYNSNSKAREHISCMVDEHGNFISYARQVEIYTYFMFGGLDGNPDMVDGELQEPENYRHEEDCLSLNFKVIKLNGSPLKRREIHMIDLMMEDHIDEVVAQEMKITVSTFNQHKKELFTKTGTTNKTALLVAAVRSGIARVFKPHYA